MWQSFIFQKLNRKIPERLQQDVCLKSGYQQAGCPCWGLSLLGVPTSGGNGGASVPEALKILGANGMWVFIITYTSNVSGLVYHFSRRS